MAPLTTRPQQRSIFFLPTEPFHPFPIQEVEAGSRGWHGEACMHKDYSFGLSAMCWLSDCLPSR